MAKAHLTKVRITGFKPHYKILMQELHRSGNLQIVENSKFISESNAQYDDHFGVFDLARVEFALDFLKPFAHTKSKIESMLSGGKLVLSEKKAKDRLKAFSPKSETIIQECEKIEDRLVRVKNEIDSIPAKQHLLETVSQFDSTISEDYSTISTTTWIGKVPREYFESFQQEVSGESNLVDLKILGKLKKAVFVRLTVWNDIKSKTESIIQKYAFDPIDLSTEFTSFKGKSLKEISRELSKNLRDYTEEQKKLEAKAKELSVHTDDLKILFDFNSWGKTKNDLQQKIYLSKKAFAFEAWVIGDAFNDLEKWIKNIFVGEVFIEKIALQEGEEEPVFLKNKWGIESFEAVTEMYGLPRVKEFDPTPLLAPFFLIFFGLCLSDVGYGLILAGIATVFLLFGQFSSAAKSTLKLLLYCGMAAITGGILLGGYFGITTEQMPFLMNPSTGLFYGQVLTPTEGTGPITFLIVALSLGVVQLLSGMLIDFVQKLKNKDYDGAFFDTAVWIFMLVSLGLFGLSDVLGLDKTLTKYMALSGALGLVLTQGRHQKNWLLKPLFGLLGLYNITNYLSDLLSYSRIMALGLATGVVGFAMNLTAGIFSEMMPHPVLGLLVATFVVIFGHFLNFSLSLLGAFIHSGRLQFIEYFGKFYEGGGIKFQPFVRQPQYLFLKK